MNEPISNILCVETFDEQTRESLCCSWTLQLTPVMREDFDQKVFPFIEVAVMQGTVTPMDDGRTEYKFELDHDTSRRIRQGILLGIMPINPN